MYLFKQIRNNAILTDTQMTSYHYVLLRIHSNDTGEKLKDSWNA